MRLDRVRDPGYSCSNSKVIRMSILKQLRAQGFDESKSIPFQKGATVGCSKCAAVVINGIACHETGCQNQVFECKGCGNTVERKGVYCADCL